MQSGELSILMAPGQQLAKKEGKNIEKKLKKEDVKDKEEVKWEEEEEKEEEEKEKKDKTEEEETEEEAASSWIRPGDFFISKTMFPPTRESLVYLCLVFVIDSVTVCSPSWP
jgi:uncharacterized membrane protein YdbT with pleckstrin-like domain